MLNHQKRQRSCQVNPHNYVGLRGAQTKYVLCLAVEPNILSCSFVDLAFVSQEYDLRCSFQIFNAVVFPMANFFTFFVGNNLLPFNNNNI